MNAWTLTYSRTHATYVAATVDRNDLLATLARVCDPSDEYRIRVRRRSDGRFDVIARRRASTNTKTSTATGSKPSRPHLSVEEKLARAAATSINLARYYAAQHVPAK